MGVENRYSGVDWSRTDAAISRDLGVTPAAVGRARKRRGIAPLDRRGPRTTRYDGVDWSRRDSEIARDLGVTPSAVTYAREARGIPQPGVVEPVWQETPWGSVETCHERLRAQVIDQTATITIRGLSRDAGQTLVSAIVGVVARHVQRPPRPAKADEVAS